MSWVFEYKNVEIWGPGRISGQVFLSQVRCLETLMGVEAGLTEYMSDTVEVDFPLLVRFLEQLSVWLNSFGSDTVALLLRGAVVHLLAIAMTSSDNKITTNSASFPKAWIQEAEAIKQRYMKLAVT